MEYIYWNPSQWLYRSHLLKKKFANLFENVSFAPGFDRAIPPVVFKLLLAVCHCQSFCLQHGLRKSGISTTLMILLTSAIDELTCARLHHGCVNGHYDVFIIDRLIRLFLRGCLYRCFFCFLSEIFCGNWAIFDQLKFLR